MKTVCFSVLVLVFLNLAMASQLFAAPYVSGNLGGVWYNDAPLSDEFGFITEMSAETGVGISAAFGNSYGSIRAEAEMVFRSNDLKKFSTGAINTQVDGYIDSLAIMVNMLLDLASNSSVVPYIGGGIGIANVESELTFAGSTGTADDSVLAYQLIAGVGIALSPAIILDLQYKYFATEDPNFDGIDTEYQTNNAFAGLRYHF